MLSRKELTLVVLTALTTAGLVVFAQSPTKPVMGSSIFDWDSLTVKPTKVGAVRNVFDTPTATLEMLECHITTLNAGEMPHPPHHHPEEELVIVREGTLEGLCNGEWKKLGPGSLMFNASNVEHGLRNVGTNQATYHVLKWRSAATPKKEAKQ